MGADLICFILKGPMKPKAGDIRSVKRHVAKVIAHAKLVDNAINRDLAAEATLEDEAILKEGLDHPLMKDMSSHEQHERVHDAAHYIAQMAEAEANQEVEDFLDWWVTCNGRDTAGRTDPDDKKKQIVVCGDMSWGDSPDGFGYTTVNRAYWFGIPHRLGIM
jgi:hypothetical protein